MTTATLDPATVIAETVRELLDSVRQLVKPDTEDPALLDELSKLLGRARRRVNRATKTAAADRPDPTPVAPARPPSNGPAPTVGTAPAATAPVVEPGRPATVHPAAITSPPQQSVTQPIPDATRQPGRSATPTPKEVPMPSATRRRLAWPIAAAVIACVAVILIILLAGCATDTEPQKFTPAPAASRGLTSRVMYEVEGDVKWANVTMQTPTGTSQQTPDVPMVRESDNQPGLEFTFNSGSYVYISAQNKDAYGTIRCRIRINGTVISENASSGGYSIATCKGTVP